MTTSASKEELIARVLDLRKRMIGDAEDGEAHREADLLRLQVV